MTAAAPSPLSFELFKPETWPPLANFKDQWDERFPDGYRVAEYVAARLEYEHITGSRAIDGDDGNPGVFGRDTATALEYWRLFWTFDGPMFKPFAIEIESNPGGPAWRVEAREMRLIPEHERRTLVDAYWAPKRVKG